MRAAWIFAYNLIDRIAPKGLSLYTLGAGLLAAGLAQFVARQRTLITAIGLR